MPPLGQAIGGEAMGLTKLDQNANDDRRAVPAAPKILAINQ
jgi:hypothetical protein